MGDSMKEIWKDIQGYEGLYQVSNLGRVKSLDRLIQRVPGTLRKWDGKVKKIKLSLGKYVRFGLYREGDVSFFIVSRLVAKAFIPNPLNKLCVNHIDNNPNNNKVENLEWVTHKENMQHAVRQGRIAYGEIISNSKLKEKDVINIRKEYSKHSRNFNTHTLAKKFKVTQATIWQIISRSTWKHIL